MFVQKLVVSDIASQLIVILELLESDEPKAR
jgi:hypothetical protein